MNIDETIYRLRQEANEWDWLRSSTKEDEENGFKCRFSEGSKEYARRVEEITQIANWLEELQTLRKAYELMAKDLNSLVSACKVSFENCPRVNGRDINRKCYECWQEDYINKAREAQNDGTDKPI